MDLIKCLVSVSELCLCGDRIQPKAGKTLEKMSSSPPSSLHSSQTEGKMVGEITTMKDKPEPDHSHAAQELSGPAETSVHVK